MVVQSLYRHRDLVISKNKIITQTNDVAILWCLYAVCGDYDRYKSKILFVLFRGHDNVIDTEKINIWA